MEILIISGLSGGGKSKAASFLEDMGFYIVDNMPAGMILKFAEFCAAGSGRYRRVALVYDVRTADSFDEFLEVLQTLRLQGQAVLEAEGYQADLHFSRALAAAEEPQQLSPQAGGGAHRRQLRRISGGPSDPPEPGIRLPPAVSGGGRGRPADGGYEHRLALLPVQGQDEAEQLPQLLHELLRLPEGKDVLPDLRVQTGFLAHGINIKGVGHKANVEHQVRLQGQAVLEAEGYQADLHFSRALATIAPWL